MNTFNRSVLVVALFALSASVPASGPKGERSPVDQSAGASTIGQSVLISRSQDESFEPAPRHAFSLLFSDTLHELQAIMDYPELVSALLMMEGQRLAQPAEWGAFAQLGSNREKSHDMMMNRINHGITFAEVAAAQAPDPDFMLRIDAMVDYLIAPTDSATIEIVMTSSPVDQNGEFGPASSFIVIASNQGNAAHEYEITSVRQGMAGKEAQRLY